MDELSDSISGQIDARKLQELVDNGELDMGDLAHASIVQVSSCCQADLEGEEIGNDVLISCSRCGALQSPEREK